jgi:hypothetical protein
VKLARLRKPKVACFLSFVEYRPNKYKQYYEKQAKRRALTGKGG